jgi:hypothetical protein
MKTKPQTQDKTKRAFQWGISSTDVRFLQNRDVEAARDGSNCGDCSKVSPLPRPKRDTVDDIQGQK